MGVYSLTISKSSLTSFSDSPRYLEVSVEEETLKKVVPHSVATALASRVLPVPGGPTINTPYNKEEEGIMAVHLSLSLMDGGSTFIHVVYICTSIISP